MFKIISDIGADIPKELKEDIIIIGQEVSIDGKDVVVGSTDDALISFYQHINNAKTLATRSLKSEEILSQIDELKGSDLLCFSFSQRLSATGSQMEKACTFLENTRHIRYYDTQTATVAQGILIYIATILRKEGKSIEQTIEYLDSVKDKLSFYVILDKSSRFLSGGRAESLDENSLYYPVLRLPLGDLYKCIGYALTKEEGISFVERKIKKKPLEILFIGHGSNVNEALELQSRWSAYANTVGTCFANPVMGVHTGDNAILVAFLEK